MRQSDVSWAGCALRSEPGDLSLSSGGGLRTKPQPKRPSPHEVWDFTVSIFDQPAFLILG